MPAIFLLPLLQIAAASASVPESASADYRLVNPKAIELFERDSTLMDWALGKYDSDHDGHLSIFEADSAAREFKRVADGDSDGQVTPAEYRSARDFIVARWVPAKAESPR
jgi:hypothetical protein